MEVSGFGARHAGTLAVASLILNLSLPYPALAAGNGPPPTVSEIAQAGVTEEMSMQIRLTINGMVATGTLDDTPTARDFASLLPLTVTLTDYASTEKVTDLPRALTLEGAPAGYQPSPGDITTYVPWGNLAIFYRAFGYSRGLVRLGKIESGIEALNQSGSLPTTIEIIE